MPDPVDIHTVFAGLATWTIRDEQVHCVTYLPDAYDEDGQRTELSIPVNDFGFFHPDLPARMQSIVSHHLQHYGFARLVARLLRCQLQHLQAPRQLLASAGELCWVADVLGIQWTPGSTHLELDVIHYDMENTLRDEITHILVDTSPFVGSANMTRLHTPVYWLDTNYPGWQSRIEVIENLDIPVEDRLTFLFPATQPQTTAAVLPDLGEG